MGALGKHSGIGAKTSAFIDQEARPPTLCRIRCTQFDRRRQWRGTYYGPGLTTTEKLTADGVSKVTRNIEAGTAIKNLAREACDYTQAELRIRQSLSGLGSDGVGCVATD